MKAYILTTVYCGSDRMILGELTPNIYSTYDKAVEAAQTMLKDDALDGYIDGVNNTYVEYDFSTDEFVSDDIDIDDDMLYESEYTPIIMEVTMD